MIRMTTSLISPIASTMLETRTSKKVRMLMSSTMARASQGQAMLTPNWFSFRLRK